MESSALGGWRATVRRLKVLNPTRLQFDRALGEALAAADRDRMPGVGFSLRKIAAETGEFSASYLSRCVGTYELLARFGPGEIPWDVPVAVVRLALPLHAGVQMQLVRRAVTERWSLRRMAAACARERGRTQDRHVPRAVVHVVQAVAELERALEVGGLSDRDRVRAVSAIRGLSRRLERAAATFAASAQRRVLPRGNTRNPRQV